MNIYKLRTDTIKENRDFKDLSELEMNNLIDTLYDFSVLSFNAYMEIDKEKAV